MLTYRADAAGEVIVDTIPSARNPAISADGRFVAFESDATDLLTGESDTNNATDVFVYDRTTKRIQRVSVNDGGEEGKAIGIQGQGHSRNPSISADGRFVAFQSLANNLVFGDSNGSINNSQGEDVFVCDRLQKTIKRISVNTINAVQGNGASTNPSISADGSYVAFSSSANNMVPGFRPGNTSIYVYIRDREVVGAINLPVVTFAANLDCTSPVISGDGKFVAFEFTVEDARQSPAQFRYTDIYRCTLSSNTLTRVTDGGDGIAAGQNNRSLSPSISADGRFTGYHSNLNIDRGDRNNLNDVYEFDALNPGEPIWLSSDSPSINSSVSGDGYSNAYIAKGGLLTRVTDKGEVAQLGAGALPSISHDGRFVAFETTSGVQVAQFSSVSPENSQNFSVKSTPKGKVLVDGSATKGFGSCRVGNKTGNVRSIIITNTGSKPLKGLKIRKDGVGAKDYSVQYSRKVLTAGASTTVKLTFKPRAVGKRVAVLHIESSETKGDPFDLNLSGKGR